MPQYMQRPDGSVVNISPNQTLTTSAGQRFQVPPAATLGNLPAGSLSSLGKTNTGIAGGMATGGWNPTPWAAGGATVGQGLPPNMTPFTQGGEAGKTPQQQMIDAYTGLGWDPSHGNQYRGQQQQMVDWLTQHGAPGWQGGGQKADDWLQDPSGGQWDFMTSGGQFVQNPDNPTAGTGGAPGGGGMAGGGGNFIDDPSYQFDMNAGLQGLQRSAASRGTLLTGGTLKGLNDWAQQYANNAYQGAFNRNMSLANLGMQAAVGMGQLGNAYGQEAGQDYGNIGSAQAAGTVGKTSPWLGALGNIGRGLEQQGAFGGVINF